MSETSQQILSILSQSLLRKAGEESAGCCLECLRLAGRQMRSEMGETNDTLMFLRTRSQAPHQSIHLVISRHSLSRKDAKLVMQLCTNTSWAMT